jgi:hypothetical protein
VGIGVYVGTGIGVVVGDLLGGVGIGVKVGSGVAVTTISFIIATGVDAGFSSASEQATNKNKITDIPSSRVSIIKHYTQI